MELHQLIPVLIYFRQVTPFQKVGGVVSNHVGNLCSFNMRFEPFSYGLHDFMDFTITNSFFLS